MFKLTPVVKNLLMVNIVVFIGGLFWDRFFSKIILDHAGQYFTSLNVLGLHHIFSKNFRPFQLLTHMFVHASFWHLLSNMIGMFFFGPRIERALGSRQFLFFCLFVGLGAAGLYSLIRYLEVHHIESLYNNYILGPTPEKFYYFISKFPNKIYLQLYKFSKDFFNHPDAISYIEESKAIAKALVEGKRMGVVVGASGVLFGILIAFGMLFPNEYMILLFFPIPIKAKYYIFMYGIYEAYKALQGFSVSNFAHAAHLGGLLFGYLYILYWKKKNIK